MSSDLRSRDMNDITALVANDHAYVRQVLDEAMRPTDTPGVRQDLVAQVVSAWATHGAAERVVVYSEAATALGPGSVERASHVHDALDRLMTDLRGDATDEQLAAVGHLVDDHVQLVEGDLLQALNDVAPDRLAPMASQWTEAVEAASGLTKPAD
jgi:Hemerythrin HHE cation binding domain